jgi:type I restriction enzyme M protein
MMVDMVQPTKEDTICDPLQERQGFLVSAGEYIHEKHPDWFHEKPENTTNYVYGVEV